MPRVLFIQNGDGEGAGLFAKVLHERGADLEVLHAWNRNPVPRTPDGWDGIIIGGGSMSAYQLEEYPFLRAEMALIQSGREAATPIFGICLGAQLMAGALGGKFFANSQKEIGFYEVTFTPEAERDPLWQGHTAPLHPVHWHGDTFTLPPGAVRLASSAITQNQLFRLDERLYGVQFHPEIDEPSLIEMVHTDEASLTRHGVDPQAFLREAGEVLPRSEMVARAIFSRWIKMLRAGRSS